MRVAIIGTAGRGCDGTRMIAGLWTAMQADSSRQIEAVQQTAGVNPGNTTLVSGGASGADHLAVRLWRTGIARSLELHLPVRFGPRGFDCSTEAGARIADFTVISRTGWASRVSTTSRRPWMTAPASATGPASRRATRRSPRRRTE